VGELLHIDVKRLGRFDRPALHSFDGHALTGEPGDGMTQEVDRGVGAFVKISAKRVRIVRK
jgi:hypothetical protein